MKEETDLDRLEKLAKALVAVEKSATSGESDRLFRALAISMQNEAATNVLQMFAQTISDLPGQLDPSDLANVLKYPNCIGELRSVVLVRLADVLRIPWQPAENPWRVITHPKLKPYVDRPLVAPQDWPTE